MSEVIIINLWVGILSVKFFTYT